MADFQALATELSGDPLGRGYSGMTDAQAAADLNTVYRTRPKDVLTGDEVFTATDASEFAALDDGTGNNNPDLKGYWLSFTAKQEIDPFNSSNVAFLRFIFGTGSATESALAGLRNEDVSRAVELGFGKVSEGNVAFARTL